MKLPCWLVGHDWERVEPMRICLRCHRLEVPISVGGGWGDWQEVTEWQREKMARDERRRKAKRLTDEAAVAPLTK